MNPPPVVALSPGDLRDRSGVAALLERSRAAVAGGLRGLLLREPELSDRVYLEAAARLAQVLSDAGGWLGLHDRAHLVAAAGAHGLHLGFRSLPPEDVPAGWIRGRALGLSTHAGDRVADASPLTYVFHGPLHATPSKEGLLDPIGAEALEAFVRACPRAVWAIGGIGPDEVRGARAAGVAGVAARAGILAAPDPGAAAGLYLRAWQAAA